MVGSIEELPHEAFVTLIPSGVLTDAEIAEKIRSYPRLVTPKQYLELSEAVLKLKGAPVTGPIRSALRSLHDLPPVPGD